MGGVTKKVIPKSLPLQGWVTGKKSFATSLKTDGSPIEQGINKAVLKASGYKSGDGKKSGGSGGSTGSSGDPMLKYMKQMQKQQDKQAALAMESQRQALLDAQRQSASSSALQGQMAAQQMLSQAGAMQQAKDIAALQAQQQASSAAGQAAIGGGYDIAKAQQEQAANLAGTGTIPTGATLPFYGMSDTITTTPTTIRSANLFNLPKTSDLKFGGQ